jgi:decaprenyl-phosphate phosphoribosyltransferase
MIHAINERSKIRASPTTLLRAHISIARFDHSIKNLFVLPGVIVPISAGIVRPSFHLLIVFIRAFAAVTLVACSNYVINEVLDAPFDRLHPTKKHRPAARGMVSLPLAYFQWIVMMVAGVAIGWFWVGHMFALVAVVLWFMGCAYNFPPIRTKDVPYLDVLSESVNNPLRMLLGWYAVAVVIPPVSLLTAYWMIGCYFMAIKRFSELREIGDRQLAGSYRKSFWYYTPDSLLVSICFYASASMLFLGAFIIRYRIELILAFPLIALTMAIYLKIAFKKDSAVQNPEKLYREPLLMGTFVATVVMMSLLLFTRMPHLEAFFMPTITLVGK